MPRLNVSPTITACLLACIVTTLVIESPVVTDKTGTTLKTLRIKWQGVIILELANQTECSKAEIRARRWNAIMKMRNGNQTYVTKPIKVLQINTGSGHGEKNELALHQMLELESPGIVFISESNMNTNNVQLMARRAELFEDYQFEDILLPGSRLARMTAAIKSDISYSRVSQLENDVNPVIVLEVKRSKRKSSHYVGCYRQWNGLSSTSQSYNTDDPQDMLQRFKLMIKIWEECIQRGDTHIFGDINVDRNLRNNPGARPDIGDLVNELESFQTRHKVTLMNNKNTRHRRLDRPTLLDLVLTNCPHKITSVTNLSNVTSEHDAVSCIVRTETSLQEPQYMWVRPSRELNAENMLPFLEGDKFNKVFNYQDPDLAFKKFDDAVQNMEDCLAPKTRVQVKKKKEDENKPSTQMKREYDTANKVAQSTGNIEDVRETKHKRNRLYKQLEKERKIQIKKNLNHLKRRWWLFKKLTSKKKTTPTNINFNNKVETSPRVIASKMGAFWYEKVSAIRRSFAGPALRAIYMLPWLLIKPNGAFQFREVTVSEVYQAISEEKPSRASGDDNLTMDSIKQCPHSFSLLLCHLFNCCIRTAKFPECLKRAKVFPTLKPGKCALQPENWRPISNLRTAEKLIEHLLKKQIAQHFEDNHIIPSTHHGGRTGFNTLTAKAKIDADLMAGMDSNKHVILFQTDLSSAYDLVDHKILLAKFKFYGVQDHSLKLLESYLADRKMFVEVQTYRSQDIQMEPVSVIQGSKLSSFFYTIYTLEVPELDKLMKDPEKYEELVGKPIPNYQEIEHSTTNYIDDSNSVICGPDEDLVTEYIQDYYDLLVRYYNLNRLKINGSKTAIMVMGPKYSKRRKIKFQLMTEGGELVHGVNRLKILGFQTNFHLDLTCQIKHTASVCSKTLLDLKPIISNGSLEQRRIILSSKCISLYRYFAPLVCSQTIEIKNAFVVQVMKIVRIIYKQQTQYMPNSRVCKLAGVETPESMMRKGCELFLHKVFDYERPENIHSLIKWPKHYRLTQPLSLNFPPKNHEDIKTCNQL